MISVSDYLCTLVISLLLIIIIFFFLPWTQKKRITFWNNLFFAIISALLFVATIVLFTIFIFCIFGMINSVSNKYCSRTEFPFYLAMVIIFGVLFAVILYTFCIYVKDYLNSLPQS